MVRVAHNDVVPACPWKEGEICRGRAKHSVRMAMGAAGDMRIQGHHIQMHSCVPLSPYSAWKKIYFFYHAPLFPQQSGELVGMRIEPHLAENLYHPRSDALHSHL
jgi:hypothetical protein